MPKIRAITALVLLLALTGCDALSVKCDSMVTQQILKQLVMDNAARLRLRPFADDGFSVHAINILRSNQTETRYTCTCFLVKEPSPADAESSRKGYLVRHVTYTAFKKSGENWVTINVIRALYDLGPEDRKKMEELISFGKELNPD